MTKELPSNPEQHQGKEYEAGQLVMLNELIREMYEVAMGENPSSASDVSLDVLQSFCIAMVQRDPELGHILVEKLEERAALRAAVAPAERYQHLDLSERLRGQLGMPPTDWSVDMPGQHKQAPPTT